MTDPLSQAFAALADPTRRTILAQLAVGPQTVGQIVAAHGLSQPGISKHLKVLQEAGLIRRERIARTRPVHLAPEGLKRAATWIDHYRQYWEGAFDRMDALIERLNEEASKNGRQ